MQNELLNTKLSKKERKRIERLLVDYHRMPAKIESAKMRAEQAVTASYSVREGSGSSAPSDPTASIAMKREEIANMERLYKILADHRELMTDDELTIWDTVYHPRHQYSPQQAADALRASPRHFHNLKDRMIRNMASLIEGRYDVTFWESERHE